MNPKSRDPFLNEVGSTFSHDELLAAFRMVAVEPGAAEACARQISEATGGSSHARNDGLFLILACVSDDAARRVAELCDEDPATVIAWRDGIIQEHGHPGTWDWKSE